MDSNSILRRIKICAESNEKNYELKGDDNSLLCITPHDDLSVEVLFKKGGIPVASEFINRASLEIFDIGSLNAPSPRTEKVVLAKIQTPNPAQSDDGEILHHVSFDLSAEETAISEGSKWMKICAFDSLGRRTTFAQGWILVAQGVGDELVEDDTAREIFAKKSEIEIFYAKNADNLARLENYSAARENLGVYSAEEVDGRISGSLLKSENLSDLSSVSEARLNLDVYSKAEIDSEIDDKLSKNSNLGDLGSTTEARENLDVFSKSEVNLELQKTLSKNSNLGDLGSTTEARENLDVFSKGEVNLELQKTLSKNLNLSDVSDINQARANLGAASASELASISYEVSSIEKHGALYFKRGKFTTAGGSFPQSAWENVTLALDVEISDLEVKVADIACLAFFTCGTGGAGRLSFSWNFPKNSKGNWFRVSGHAPNYTKVFGRNFYLPDELVLGRHTIMVCFGEHVPLETGGYMACKVFWDGIPMQFTDDSTKTFDASGGFLNSGYFYFGGSINVNPQINLNQEKDCPIDIKIHRYKIFNYDISAADAPYSLSDFAAGKLVPPSLRKNDSTQKILWEMADYTYPENSSTRLILDESGNGGNATITGDIAGDKDGASDVFISKLKEQVSQLS